MKRILSVLAVGCLAGVLWATGASTSAKSTNTASGEGAAAFRPEWTPDAEPAMAIIEPETVRRERFNMRMQAMIQSGKGARLSDAKPARPQVPSSSVQPFRAQRLLSSRRDEAASTTMTRGQEVSTIAPPLVRSNTGLARLSKGSYTPPRLDLTTMPTVPNDDVECLTQALYYEARNESEEGQAAVAEVIINRSRAGTYPRKICDVVYQRNSRTCQFTFTCDGSIGRRSVSMTAWGRAERIARSVYEGRANAQLPKNSVNYHANYVRPSWGARLQRVRQIGAHIFYGAALNGQATPGAERSFASPDPRRNGLVFTRNDAWERTHASLLRESTTDVDAHGGLGAAP